ncbi:MAG: hypothetical protein FJ096_13565 [Deltaproteobacteria bacterium]|nr:hypothetical protein [Deltaproteobacteria bacterium]
MTKVMMKAALGATLLAWFVACSDEVTTSSSGGVGGAASATSGSTAMVTGSGTDASTGVTDSAATGSTAMVTGSGTADTVVASSSAEATATAASSVVASSSATGGFTKCDQACTEIYVCGLAMYGGKQLCPGLSSSPMSKSAFLSYCVPKCQSITDFIFFVIPEDCPATISSFNGLGAEYAAVCKSGPK